LPAAPVNGDVATSLSPSHYFRKVLDSRERGAPEEVQQTLYFNKRVGGVADDQSDASGEVSGTVMMMINQTRRAR
jgi:hypothetical protein